MSHQDDVFYRNFGIVLGVLTLITLFLIIFANSSFLVDAGAADTKGNAEAEAIAARIKPAGSVNTEEVKEEPAATTAAAEPQTPEEIYTGVCSVCHIAGVSGAPKPDDTAAWQERYSAKGLDGLTASVINGLNAMPPRAGRADLSDEDLQKTVKFMLTNAKVEVSESAEAPAVEAVADKPAETVAETVEQVAESVAQTTAETVEKAEEAAKEAVTAVEQAVENTVEKVEETVTEAKEEGLSLAGYDLAQGEATYRKACFACHDAGVAGAPKLGDAAGWSERLAKGMDMLFQNSLKGIGGMPPKGGHMYLSDDEVKNGVAYMLSKSVK